METFADQAVIAIENARLFTELQAKNADLTEALEQQTATAEILRVIAQLADRRPAGASTRSSQSAARLCDAGTRAVVSRRRRADAPASLATTAAEQARGAAERVPDGRSTRGSVAGRAVVTRPSSTSTTCRTDP